MELLFSITAAECRWDYFRGGGKGGQKKQKTPSAVRCLHIKSGAIGTASDSRSQWENKKSAFRRMAETERFKKWIRLESLKRMGMDAIVEENVRRAMQPQNIRVEYKEDGRWVDESEPKAT